MVVINYSGEEINAKIVYYGPGLSGKTTNLEFIYSKMPTEVKGKMVSMKTRTDRTLFFDFLPIELGDVSGYRTRFLLYTVPGQVYYNATRKLVLKGADAVVFVADSSREKLNENLESLRNLEENLNEHDLTLDTIPWVIQYNKRDAEDAMSVDELDEQLNLLQVPSFEAVATEGTGIYETFQGIARLLYLELKNRFEGAGSIRKGPAGAPEPVREAIPEHPAAVSPAPPQSRAERPAETCDVGESQETLSSVVDNALREVDSTVDFEREEKAVMDSSPREEEESEEYQFTSMNGMDEGLGRVLELDDAMKSGEADVDVRKDAGHNGFIKDPCRTRTAEEKSTGESAHTVQVEIRQSCEPAREAPPVSASVITVPVAIPRSQVRKNTPLKLMLEIRFTEDES